MIKNKIRSWFVVLAGVCSLAISFTATNYVAEHKNSLTSRKSIEEYIAHEKLTIGHDPNLPAYHSEISLPVISIALLLHSYTIKSGFNKHTLQKFSRSWDDVIINTYLLCIYPHHSFW